jgi:hypothetical protein
MFSLTKSFKKVSWYFSCFFPELSAEDSYCVYLARHDVCDVRIHVVINSARFLLDMRMFEYMSYF